MTEEIKSVKVDNWGVFFLQKLQNFFNKTDYCDLTLQFRDNSQLKVHRLVLSACTDYFNVLEQTCDVVDDALIMPNELQADVVVPIVNFMYTGTLEFELRMYGRLLRTAKEMNMTVLLKLLEAHRRTMEGATKPAGGPSSPISLRRKAPQAAASAAKSPQQQQHRVCTTKTVTPPQAQQRKVAFGKNQQSQVITRQIGATSVTSTTAHKEPMSTDNFEQLRRGYNNNKRPSTNTLVAPAAKKPNIEDVKEFSEQQRMRKQIAAEFGEDPEYESILDDDIHDDDDDDDNTGGAGAAGSANVSGEGMSTRQVQRQKQQKLMQAHEQATITIKQGIGDQPATIIVKDATNSKMNHERIISEVLRQYPHLVKGSKNIKLKIMPNAAGGQNPRAVKKTEPTQPVNTSANESNSSSNELQGVPTSTTTTTGTNIQKRRIDSKTMHSLIAMGAENMTGPWLCLRCGINGRPISIPSYRSFRRHLVNTHKEKIDAALCENCGWRSSNDRELHFHLEQEHKIKSTQYTFPVCPICSVELLDSNTLNQHMQENHANEEKQQCIYCNKIFGRELQLYQHMKSYHKKQAIEDGIIDYEDEEYLVESLMQKDSDPESKVKILSDISLPVNEKLDSPSSEAAGLSTVASSIAASIGVHCDTSTGGFDESFENGKVEETKFINADGNEMVLTEEQRKEIMAQLNQENVGGTVMVLQDDEKAAAMETAEEDDSQIYKELNQEEETLKTTETKEKPIKQDINQKLKELTGDWSDEEDEFAELPTTQATNTDTQTVSPTAIKDKNEAAAAAAASSVVEEDDIDLALKNLHTDASLDMPTEQMNEEENAENVKEENLDVEMSEEAKEENTVHEQQEADTQMANEELRETETELQHNTSLIAATEAAEEEQQAHEVDEEDFDLKKSTEHKLEDELDEKEGNTLLDDLLAEAQVTESKTVTSPVEEEMKEELISSVAQLSEDQEHETIKEQTETETEAEIETETDLALESSQTEAEGESETKEIQGMKLYETTTQLETKLDNAVVEENKTQQTVKSLISEWADDDDDDGDEDEDDKL